MNHKVEAQAGEEAEVNIYGDTYTVTLDNKAKAELVIYGQIHTVEGQPKSKKAKKQEDAPTE